MPDTLSRSDQSKDEGPSYDPKTDAPEEDEWDRQIERDAEAGRLDALAERAREEARAGNLTDLHGNPTGDESESR